MTGTLYIEQDYESGPYTVTFPVGETRAQFNVSIIMDDAYELNETFHLTIDSSSLLSDISAANPYQATVIIINDDRKYKMHC